MMYTNDFGRFLSHVFGTGRVFVFSEDGGDIRLSSAFADFAFLRPTFEEGVVREKTEYIDSAMVRYLCTTVVNQSGNRVSSVDTLTFCGNPVTGVMVLTAVTVSGLELEVMPFSDVRSVPHTVLSQGKTDDRQYLRLLRGKRSVYIVPDVNASVSNDGRTLLFGSGTARILIIEPGASGGVAKVKRLAGTPITDADVAYPLYNEAIIAFSARTAVYLEQARFGDGLFSELAKSCFRVMRNMRSRYGGIRCVEQSCCCDAHAMSDYLLFATVFELRPIADGIADTFYRMMKENRRFPQIFTSDGSDVSMPYNATSISGLAAIIGLFRYEEHFRLPHTRLRFLAENVLSEQLSLIKSGSLPFSGIEMGFLTGDVSGDERFQGSAMLTLMFIRAASIYLSLPAGAESKTAPELRSAIAHIKRNFRQNFCMNDTVFSNSVRRYMNMRLPHSVTGYCRECGKYTLLVHNAHGYICRLCGNDNGGAGYSEERHPMPSAPFYISRYAPGICEYRLPTTDDLRCMSLRELSAGIGFYRCDRVRQTEVIMEIARRYTAEPSSFSPHIMCRVVADMRLYRSFEFPKLDIENGKKPDGRKMYGQK